MSGAVSAGRMYRRRTRGVRAPRARAPSTIVCSRSESTEARTTRMTRGISGMISAMITLRTLPSSSVGCRRASRRRRSRTLAASAARVAATSALSTRTEAAISVFDARVEDDVEDVDHQVQRDVDARYDEDDPLDHGIVAPDDGVDREPAQAGQREHALGDHRAADEQ